MKRCGLSSASAFSRVCSSSDATVTFAATSVTSNGRPSPITSETTCSTGTPVLSRRRSGRSRFIQPDVAAGSVETMTSSMPSAATASVAARNGSSSPTSPPPGMPLSRMNASIRSTRTCAMSRTASS